MKFGDELDLCGHEIQNFGVEQRSTYRTNPIGGQLQGHGEHLAYYNGVKWITLADNSKFSNYALATHDHDTIYEPILPPSGIDAELKYLNGNRLWSEIQVSPYSFMRNLYLSHEPSIYGGSLSNEPDTPTPIDTLLIANAEEIIGTFVGGVLEVDTIDKGTWTFNLNMHVELGFTAIVDLTIEVYSLNQSFNRVLLFSKVETEQAIPDQEEQFVFSYDVPSIPIDPTLKLIVVLKATSLSDCTLTIQTGPLCYITMPYRMSHTILSEYNKNPLFQHINASDRTILNNTSGKNTGDQVADNDTITGAGTASDPFVGTPSGMSAEVYDTANKKSQVEVIEDRLSEFQDTPDDVHYPSEKLVYDKLADLDAKKYDKNAADLLLGAKANLLGGNTFSGNQNFDSNLGIGTANPTSQLHIELNPVGIGTVSVEAGGTTVTGVGTKFLNQYHQGGFTITIGAETRTILYCTSDTSMVVSSAFTNAYSNSLFTISGVSKVEINGNSYAKFSYSNVITEINSNNNGAYGLRTSSAIKGSAFLLSNNIGGFYTYNGTPMFYTTAAGKFGIGTTTPNGFLEVKGSGGIILDAGNVGIGTTTPAAKLDVNGTSNFADNMNILSTKNQYLAASPTSDTVNDIRVRNDSGVLKTERCTVANATKGAGTWVDASKADITPANGSTSALRALFTSVPEANCVYNTNTGYYEMNGITNLTELDVTKSYHFLQAYKIQSSGAYQMSGIRTNFYLDINGNADYNCRYWCQNVTTLEVFKFHSYTSIIYTVGMFIGCSILRTAETFRMTNITNVNNALNMFHGCVSLETAYLRELKISFSFAWSPLLSLASLQYLVTNRTNGTTRITITVHPTVWAKLNDNVGYPTWNALLVDAVANQYIDFASA